MSPQVATKVCLPCEAQSVLSSDRACPRSPMPGETGKVPEPNPDEWISMLALRSRERSYTHAEVPGFFSPQPALKERNLDDGDG